VDPRREHCQEAPHVRLAGVREASRGRPCCGLHDQTHHYTNRIADRRTPVLCTTEGYDVQTPGPQYDEGDCFRKPSGADTPLGGQIVFGGLQRVGCGSSGAWGKVVGSVSEEHCPRGTAYELLDTHFYPGPLPAESVTRAPHRPHLGSSVSRPGGSAG
jgi:hypothetical protein